MKLKNFTLIATLMLATVQMLSAATLKGIVVDQTTGAPLLGATVMVKGTTVGTATSFDGTFEIKVDNEETLVVSYISYLTQEIAYIKGLKDLNITLVPDTQVLASVQVVTRANLETEANLQQQRMTSNVAIENIGIREMSLKGLSNAEDGVKKMTGISIADAGQVIVRGLGDRYSITTLNGLPIASPNPDNKLAPLDIFPSMAVKNITVSKVYDASAYADYAGAHIDIATKNLEGGNFFSLGFGVGADFSAVGNPFFKMDNVSLFSMPTYDKGIESAESKSTYFKNNEVFDTTYDVEEITGMPSFKANVGWGHSYDVGSHKLSLLVTAGVDNDNSSIESQEFQSLSANGNTLSSYNYDSYTSSLDIASLASVGLTLRSRDRIGYTFFYARNAMNEFTYNYDGFNNDKDLYYQSINNLTRVYGMMTNQLMGYHELNDKLNLNWRGAYTTTSSNEPDNRQLLVEESGDDLVYYCETSDEINRMFTNLDETEYSFQVEFDYSFNEKNKLSAGVAYKDKSRDFTVTTFSYNMANSVGQSIGDLYSQSSYLTQDNLIAGAYTMNMKHDYTCEYDAGSSVFAAFATASLQLSDKLLMDVGLRLEGVNQFVNYQGAYDLSASTSTIDDYDFFPALNLKYEVADKRQIRFAASKTVTRPSFLEMAPYEYYESYGAPIIRGNADIENGYNYNADLRYEALFNSGDMLSFTAYYKYLDTPIERVTEPKSGGILYSFQNTDSGMAAGVEFEMRKKLVGDLRLGLNGSYMYTKVELQANGAYTNSERDLQGASPYLVNADLTYTPKINDKQLSLALLYNLQGPRIHAVGLYNCGDIVQRSVNMLNFTASYDINKVVKIGAKLSNILSMDYVYEQEMPQANKTYVVERYNPGMSGEVSVSLKF